MADPFSIVSHTLFLATCYNTNPRKTHTSLHKPCVRIVPGHVEVPNTHCIALCTPQWPLEVLIHQLVVQYLDVLVLVRLSLVLRPVGRTSFDESQSALFLLPLSSSPSLPLSSSPSLPLSSSPSLLVSSWLVVRMTGYSRLQRFDGSAYNIVRIRSRTRTLEYESERCLEHGGEARRRYRTRDSMLHL